MPFSRRAAVLVALLLAACAGPAGDAAAPSGPTAAPSTAAASEPTPGVDTATEPAAGPSPAPAASAERPGGEVLPVDRWSRLADAPTGLTEVGAAAFGGGVWTAGGLAVDGQAVDSVLIYDPTFDGWERGPSLPLAVHHAALVSTGDALYQVGGYAGAGFDTPTAEVAVFDAATGGWADGPPLPAPRAAGAAAWDGNRVVYGGGVGPDGLAGEVWALEGDAWVPLGELSEPREHLAGASDGAGRMWFLGGRTGGLDTNLGAVDLVDAEGIRRIGDLPTPRGGVAGLHLPGAGACALGGEAPEATFAEVECVDADGRTTTLPPLEEGRHGLGAVVVEGAAYAVLGGPQPGLHVSPVLEVLPVRGGG